MQDYRPVYDGDLNEFHRLLNYAFWPTESFEPIESSEDIPAPATVGESRGLYDDGELVSTVTHHWLTLRIRGEYRAVAGVSAVSTPPKHRRKGFVRQLLFESLREYRKRDQYYSVLWPFEYSFYRKFGWGMCNEAAAITCSPDALSFVDRVNIPSDSAFVDLDTDRWEELARVYEACNDHDLAMRRTEEWWRKRVFQGWKSDPYVSGWERDGELRGYLVYAIEEEDDRTMNVWDIGYVDHEAYVELIRFCRYHDSQVECVSIRDADGTVLHDCVDDPREVEIEISPGPMIRIVDVERALSDLSYSAGGSVVLSVNDELADWNDGCFRLTVEDGTASCEPTTENPDATVDVATLSQIAVGYYSVERAIRIGNVAATESAGRTLSKLFPKRETFLREGF